MDDQDVPQDARKDQEPKQNSIYSKNSGHGIILCMETWFDFSLCSACVRVRDKRRSLVCITTAADVPPVFYTCTHVEHTQAKRNIFITHRGFHFADQDQGQFNSVCCFECTCKDRHFPCVRSASPINCKCNAVF